MYENIDPKRRQFILAAGAGLFIAWLAVGKPRSLFSILSQKFRQDDSISGVGFRDFHTSSAAILGIAPATLDTALAYSYWTVLATDPAHRRQLRLLAGKIKVTGKSTFLNLGELPTSVHAIAQIVLRVWYTGVVSTGLVKNQRVGYLSAFMFSLFNFFRPAPGNCGGSFGYWIQPPSPGAENIPK
jgi:hypothetical protein